MHLSSNFGMDPFNKVGIEDTLIMILAGCQGVASDDKGTYCVKCTMYNKFCWYQWGDKRPSHVCQDPDFWQRDFGIEINKVINR